MGATLYATFISALFWIPLTILFLRIALPLVRAPFSDPLVGWVYTISNPVLRPLERLIPRWRNLSLSAVLLYWLVASLEFALLVLQGNPLAWLVGGLGGGISFALGFLIGLILLYTLFSLFQPREGTSIVFLTTRLASPACRVFRRFVPMIGPFDLSPALAMLTLLLLRIVVPGLCYELAARLA